MVQQDKFTTFIKQHALFTPSDKLLVAVSGGRDSVLLAHLLKFTGHIFSIAHCNFNLRGDESQRDEAFVSLLANTLDAPFFCRGFETEQFAHTHKISIQMAARQLRYDWFSELAALEGFGAILIAHHQNDAVETILLNLTRGTGISGLHGILPKTGNIVRPLLCFNSEEINTMADELAISYVEDSSNQSSYYARNKIRNQIIPHLKELNPSLEHTFEQNIERFAATEAVLQQVVAQCRAQLMKTTAHATRISLQQIRALNPQRLLFFELLRPYNFSAHVVDELLAGLDKQTGTSFFSNTHRATIDRDDLLITAADRAEDVLELWHPAMQSLNFKETRLKLTVTLQLPWQFDPKMAYVDHEQLIFPLVVRTWQAGDSFMPFGMRTFKRLSDFFIDQKIALPDKQHIPVLVNGNSEIIWIGGHRQDDRYKVTSSTKKVAIFEIENNDEPK